MKLGTRTANLWNSLMEGVPGSYKIGDGATILCWTDREAGTIIEATPKRIVVQTDNAVRTDANGMSESQEYRYERDEKGRLYIFTLRRNGKWTQEKEKAGSGPGLSVGRRDHYHDYSF